MPLLVLSILVQLALVVHVFKTGRNTTWVFILLIFPLIGTLAYFIVELLPELMGSRTGHRARKKLSTVMDPTKGLRAAEDSYAVAGTVKNAMVLAEQYLERGRFAEAKELYLRSMSGIYRDDPVLLMGLAQAQFGLGEHQAALDNLDTLKQKNPESTSEEGHLLYAKCLQEVGRTAEAISEFESLASYYAGPEPSCRLALLYKRNGETEKAREIFATIVARSKRANSHYRSLHGEWVTIARNELK